MSYGLLNQTRVQMAWLAGLLLLSIAVGVLARGYWTPDEPREADIAWRMSWQSQKSVPLLAGEAFCEKPPFTYWLAAVPMRLIGTAGWAARLPNIVYALVSALAVGLLAARSLGPLPGMVGAAAISTFLLSYQVAIWLATDAPLLAAVSLALLGAYRGFYAEQNRQRLLGYLLMHLGTGLGFLCKSAAGWLVPAMTMITLIIWERRWRELLRWELYAGLVLQAALILTWVWFVYAGPDGPAHLRVFFWNNLVGRFTPVDAPSELQYAAAHRNTPGKYFIELPIYLFPWTLLVLAALRCAWQGRSAAFEGRRAVRFALSAFIPALLLLSVAATARNIYLAPALPGVALLLAWWTNEMTTRSDRWDLRALRATSALLLLSSVVVVAALIIVATDAWHDMSRPAAYIVISSVGVAVSIGFAIRAWISAANNKPSTLGSLLLAYCALLIGPASQIYAEANRWQDLGQIARDIKTYAADRPLILLAPDETTRAVIDMYASTSVRVIEGPLNPNVINLAGQAVLGAPNSLIVVLVPGRAGLRSPGLKPGPVPTIEAALPWMKSAHLKLAQSYWLPHGRRYALLVATGFP